MDMKNDSLKESKEYEQLTNDLNLSIRERTNKANDMTQEQLGKLNRRIKLLKEKESSFRNDAISKVMSSKEYLI